MPILENHHFPGIFFWGTKKGKSVFLSHNIVPNKDTLDSWVSDVRKYNQLISPGNEFYCIDQKPDCRIFSVVHILKDDFDRTGYLAVSLLVPKDRWFVNRNFGGMLSAIKDAYIKEYVMPGYPAGKFISGLLEDIALFAEFKEHSSLALTEAGAKYQVAGAPKGVVFLAYDSPAELTDYLNNCHRKELQDTERIFLLPQQIADDTKTRTTLTTLPPFRNALIYTLKLKASDGIDLTGVRVIRQTEDYLQTETKLINAAVDFEVEPDTRFSIKIEKEGYLPKQIKEYEFKTGHDSDHREFEATLDKIPPPTEPENKQDKPKPEKKQDKSKPEKQSDSHRDPGPQGKYKLVFLAILLAACVSGFLMFKSCGKEPNEPVINPGPGEPKDSGITIKSPTPGPGKVNPNSMFTDQGFNRVGFFIDTVYSKIGYDTIYRNLRGDNIPQGYKELVKWLIVNKEKFENKKDYNTIKNDLIKKIIENNFKEDIAGFINGSTDLDAEKKAEFLNPLNSKEKEAKLKAAKAKQAAKATQAAAKATQKAIKVVPKPRGGY